jgi:hypothetical protein
MRLAYDIRFIFCVNCIKQIVTKNNRLFKAVNTKNKSLFLMKIKIINQYYKKNLRCLPKSLFCRFIRATRRDTVWDTSLGVVVVQTGLPAVVIDQV